MNAVYSSLGADPDLGELVCLFVNELPERLTTLQRLFDEGNRDELCRAAHQIRGAAGSYGFHAVTPYASRLELALRTDRSEEQVKEELDSLIELCRTVRAGAPQ